MHCLDSLNANEGIVYCVAWSPLSSDDRLVAAMSRGPLVLWDTKRGQLLLVIIMIIIDGFLIFFFCVFYVFLK